MMSPDGKAKAVIIQLYFDTTFRGKNKAGGSLRVLIDKEATIEVDPFLKSPAMKLVEHYNKNENEVCETVLECPGVFKLRVEFTGTSRNEYVYTFENV